jgi:hypothetical protein
VGTQRREAPYECLAAFSPSVNSSVARQFDEAEIKALIEFFILLDTWERKSHATENL